MDYLNGLFGRYVGGNSAINTFVVVLTIENIASLIAKKKSLKKTLVNVFIMSITCALNEIKIYYLELIIIVLFALFINFKNNIKNLIKSFGIIIIFFAVMIIGGTFFLYLYPNFKSILNWDYFIYYSTRSYNSSTVLYHEKIPIANRLTVFNIVDKYFLKNTAKKILGIGMGAADTSTYITNTFYSKYGPISYGAFLFGIVFLENGIIGLLFFLFFFIYIIYHAKKGKKNIYAKYERIISGTVAILGILGGLYNASLKIESSGYIYFTFLAIMFVKSIPSKQENLLFEEKCSIKTG